LRFDISDLLRAEDQQTANRRLCQCPNLGGSSLKQSAVNLGVDAFRAKQHAIKKRPDRRANLPLVNCPMLVIVGDADEVTPPDRALEIHKGMPGSEFITIPKSGHCPPLEHPQNVNRLLETWFSRHSGNPPQPAAQTQGS
jgi:pimeloyl-ACP methyl ester carboxylesterase